MTKVTARSDQLHQYLCDLRKAGNKPRIKRLTHSPAYACGICGEVANRRENLCDSNPLPLHGPKLGRH